MLRARRRWCKREAILAQFRAMSDHPSDKSAGQAATATASQADAHGKAEPQIVEFESGPASTAEQRELGGPQGPEPTRFGDWERKGRCIDF